MSATILVGAALLLAGGTRGGEESDPVKRGIDALKGDAQARVQAAQQLGRLGAKAQAAAPALIETLADPDAAVRIHAAAALSRLGGSSSLKAALPVLLEGRNHPDAAIRAAAETAWSQVGPGVRATVLYLREQLRRPDAQAQERASTALAKQGLEIVPTLLDVFTLKYVPTSPFAGVTPASASFASVNPAVASGDFNARQEDAQLRTVAVAAFGKLSLDATPTLVAALRDRDPMVREGAAQTLGRLRPTPAEALGPLVAAIQDRDPWVRLRAVEALAGGGPGGGAGAERSPAASEALAKALEHKDAMVRRAAVQALTAPRIDASPINRGLSGLPASSPSTGMMNISMSMGTGMGVGMTPNTPSLLISTSAFGPLSSGVVDPAVVPALTAALADPDAFVRLKAAEALAQATPPVPAAVPALLEHLSDRDVGVRQRAGQVLEALAPLTDLAVVPALRRLLQERDPFTRLTVARVLYRAGAAEKDEALTELRRLLDHEDVAPRFLAAGTLWELGQVDDALPVFIAALGSSGFMNYYSQTAQQILQRPGPNAKVVAAALADALQSDDLDVQRAVLQVLKSLGAAAAEAAPALMPVAVSDDMSLRIPAIQTLEKLGTLPKEVVPTLLNAVKEGDANRRSSLIPLLGRLGAESKAAVPVLAGLLNDPSLLIRNQAVQILRPFAEQAPAEAAPLLVDALKHPTPNVRSVAASALMQMAAEGVAPALPGLTALLSDSDPSVRQSALQILSRSGEAKGAALALAKALRDENPAIRSQALQALQSFNPQALAELQPALIERFHDADRSVRTQVVALATASAARDSRVLLPILLELSRDPETTLRDQAVSALGRLSGGATDQEITPVLRDRLTDSSPSIRFAAAQALIASPTRSDEFQAALKTLLELLDESQPIRRERVAAVLEVLGPRARAARPALTVRLNDATDRSARLPLALALAQMGREGRETARPVLVEAIQSGTDADGDRDRALATLLQLGPLKGGLPVPTLLELLRSRNGQISTRAAQALGQLGPAAHEAIPPLAEWLRTGEPGDRFQAARGLQALGPAGVKAAGPVLVELIKDDDVATRNQLVGLLRSLPGVNLGPTISQLAETLDEVDQNARFRIILTLRQLGPFAANAVPALRAALKTASPNERVQLAKALEQITGEDEPSLFPLQAEYLRMPQPLVRVQEALHLANQRPHGVKSARPVLIELATADDTFVRHQALQGLSQLRGPELIPAVPCLIKAVNHPEPATRNQAAGILMRMGPAARDAIPALAAQLSNNAADQTTAFTFIRALAALGPDAVPALTNVLKANRPTLRDDVIDALGRFGPGAGPAAPALAELLQTHVGNRSLRPRLVAALSRIGLDAAPALIGLLNADDPLVRLTAAQLLGPLGAEAKEAIPALKRALDDKDAAVRAAAADALQRIGGDAETAAVVPVLAAGLKHADPQVQRTATAALARITPVPPELASDLVAALNHGDGPTRLNAATALAGLPGRADEALVEFIDALDAPNVRDSALDALTRLGPVVKEIVPALIERLNDWNDGPAVGRLAHALARIAGDEAVEPLVKACGQAGPQVRPFIVAALATTGPAGAEALIRRLDDDRAEVRRQAAQTLASLDSEDKAKENAAAVVAALRKALSDPEPAVRLEAAVGLAKRGNAADPAVVAPLHAAVADRAAAEHSRAVEMLGCLGPAAAPAVPTLILELKIEDGAPLLRAVEALGRIGPPARAAVPALERLLGRPDLPTRCRAALALWAIGGDDQAATVAAVLIDTLDSPIARPAPLDSPPFGSASASPALSPTRSRQTIAHLDASLKAAFPDPAVFRREIVETLGRMKGRARAAVPALRRATRETDPALRAAAVAAITSIEAAGATGEEAR